MQRILAQVITKTLDNGLVLAGDALEMAEQTEV
jgi:hypothetical protein